MQLTFEKLECVHELMRAARCAVVDIVKCQLVTKRTMSDEYRADSEKFECVH